MRSSLGIAEENSNSWSYVAGEVVGTIATAGIGAAAKEIGAADTAAVPPYSRELYQVNSRSAAATEARAASENTPCPKCGDTMISGTESAPWAQHDPPLSRFHYEDGGAEMTPEEKKAYANSAKAYDESNCAKCQRKEGENATYTRKKNQVRGNRPQLNDQF